MGPEYRARIGEDEGEAARDPEPKQARTFTELTKYRLRWESLTRVA